MKARVLVILIILATLATLAFAESRGKEYIVKLSNGQSIRDVNDAAGTRTVRKIRGTSLYLVRADGGNDDDDDDSSPLRKLKHAKGVDRAERNDSISLQSVGPLAISSDKLNQDAVELLDGQSRTIFYGTSVLQAYVNQPALALTKVNNVRNVSTGVGTSVAYIDTGVDFTHPALQPWLDPGVDLVNGSSASELDGLNQDAVELLDQDAVELLDKRFWFMLNSDGNFPSAFGHGTLVAGMIHAVAPQARIVPIKAFDAYGNTTMFRVVEGVYSAIDLGVDVLNMSFSSNTPSDTFQEAINAARNAGIIVVSSVGNDSHDAGSVYPAAYPGVYGVAATDFNDKLASFSDFGSSVSVVAPGSYVISTVPGGHYAAAWGTSFSAPIVSGSIALVASLKPHGASAGPSVVTSADSIDALNPGFERKLGKGRVNMQSALKVKGTP